MAKLQSNQEWALCVKFSNNASCTFYGDTKKEANQKFLKKYGNNIGVEKIWTVEDK